MMNASEVKARIQAAILDEIKAIAFEQSITIDPLVSDDASEGGVTTTIDLEWGDSGLTIELMTDRPEDDDEADLIEADDEAVEAEAEQDDLT